MEPLLPQVLHIDIFFNNFLPLYTNPLTLQPQVAHTKVYRSLKLPCKSDNINLLKLYFSWNHSNPHPSQVHPFDIFFNNFLLHYSIRLKLQAMTGLTMLYRSLKVPFKSDNIKLVKLYFSWNHSYHQPSTPI